MPPTTKAICAALISLALSACAVQFGQGKGVTAIADSDQASLEKEYPYGATSTKDVLLKLGPPTEKIKLAGLEVWTYKYERAAAIGVLFVATPIGSKKTANFYFNDGTGILEKIDYKKESH